jgi:hypothetical protein
VLDRLESPSSFVKRLTQYSCAHRDRPPVRRRCETQENSAVLLQGRGKQTVVLPELGGPEFGLFRADHDDRDGRKGIDGNHILRYEVVKDECRKRPTRATLSRPGSSKVPTRACRQSASMHNTPVPLVELTDARSSHVPDLDSTPGVGARQRPRDDLSGRTDGRR